MSITEHTMRCGSAEKTRRSSWVTIFALTGTMMLYGCAGPALPKTPNLYVQGDATALEVVPPARQTVDIDLLYATDRMPIEANHALLKYAKKRRSHSLAVGSANVRLGEDLSW